MVSHEILVKLNGVYLMHRFGTCCSYGEGEGVKKKPLTCGMSRKAYIRISSPRHAPCSDIICLSNIFSEVSEIVLFFCSPLYLARCS